MPATNALQFQDVARVFRRRERASGLAASLKAFVSPVYVDKLAVRDLNFSVQAGSCVGLVGANGAGKTTLLNILSGLDRPTQGEVIFSGKNIVSYSEKEKNAFLNKKAGFVFQFYHLLSEFTALENAMMPALIGGAATKSEAQSKARQLLARVGLAGRETHFPQELSGGEQQRVAIARAPVNVPEILFCDEPTGNLDRERGLEIAEILHSLFRDEGKTVLIVTHDERIAKMADKVLDLVHGRFI